MIDKYYQKELEHLRELAVEFSQAHPALAPMLGDRGNDPDVERLLEGTAFLSGIVNQKLDDEFPEIVNGLAQLVFPHYLRAVPATTIVRFTPRKSLMESMTITKGTQLASIPVEGTPCLFATTYDVELHPLSITDLSLVRGAGEGGTLTISLKLDGMRVRDLDISSLRFHVMGSSGVSSRRYKGIFQGTKSITFKTSDGSSSTVGREYLKEVGFSDDQALLPYPSVSFPGYRFLQEYFILPEKFLFFDIAGFKNWKHRGNGESFQIILELDSVSPSAFERINKDALTLFATPVINLFKKDAEPVSLDHKRAEYRVRPSGESNGENQIHSIDSVTGLIQGTVEQRDYKPFHMFNPQASEQPVYSEHQRQTTVRDRSDFYISVAYPKAAESLVRETLSISTTCTNGDLPGKLGFGDICKETDTSPQLATFENIHRPTFPVQPPLGKNLLWRLLSHLYLNYTSVANVDSLRTMLKLYIFTDTSKKEKVIANTKRVDAIKDMAVTDSDRLVKGLIMRGLKIHLVIDGDGFADSGDLYIFGGVLNHFFAGYASMNCFTQLTVEDQTNKERFIWPAMLGKRTLL